MPTGVVQWLDPRTGEGRVMDRGRRYAVRVESMESKARYPGARVHFDIDHHAAGDVAMNVELREGTRVSPRQRRFGDLVGARARETKIESWRPDDAPMREPVTHPVRVATAWAEHLSAGESGGAARLYAPTASYHADGEVVVGPKRIRRALEDHPVFALDLAPEEVEGTPDGVRIRWSTPGRASDADELESHLAIEHGEIVEQWTGETRAVVDVDADIGPIELSVEGVVEDADRDRAVDAVRRVLSSRRESVHHVSIRLEWLADPAQEPRARARVTTDIDGEVVRASVRSATVRESIDRLVERLVERLRRRAEHRRTLRRRGPSSGPGEWRHGDAGNRTEPSRRLDASQRAVVRRPTWSAEPSTIDEAVFDLEVLDLDFLLFSDLASGADAVVHRLPGGSYAVRLADVSEPGHRTASAATVEFDPTPTAHLTVDEARQHLDQGGEEWVFFVDPSTGRGNVLHRRDDGHDGLITPRLEATALVESS